MTRIESYKAFPKLQPFNRDAKFIVRRAIKVSGVQFDDGDVLDKSLLTTRRLRQLHEQRFIFMDETTVADGEKPNFLTMPTGKVKEWIIARGVQPRFNAKRDALIKQAERLWTRLYGEGVDGVVT